DESGSVALYAGALLPVGVALLWFWWLVCRWQRGHDATMTVGAYRPTRRGNADLAAFRARNRVGFNFHHPALLESRAARCSLGVIRKAAQTLRQPQPCERRRRMRCWRRCNRLLGCSVMLTPHSVAAFQFPTPA